MTLGPEPRAGNFIRLDPDAVCLVTRDYLVDPARGTQATWRIEAVDPAPPPRPSDADAAARFRAAGDAAYAMGSFQLADDEALVLEGTSPPCAFWNLCLWNPFLQTYDYRYERVTLNGGQVRHEADGSWRVVIAARDPGTPDWVSTAGHQKGRIWFRWFLPEGAPHRPRAKVVPAAQLAR